MSDTKTAGWYEDPTGRHQMRYHDGSDWTAHVIDPMGDVAPQTAPPPPASTVYQPTNVVSSWATADPFRSDSTPSTGVSAATPVAEVPTHVSPWQGVEADWPEDSKRVVPEDADFEWPVHEGMDLIDDEVEHIDLTPADPEAIDLVDADPLDAGVGGDSPDDAVIDLRETAEPSIGAGTVAAGLGTAAVIGGGASFLGRDEPSEIALPDAQADIPSFEPASPNAAVPSFQAPDIAAEVPAVGTPDVGTPDRYAAVPPLDADLDAPNLTTPDLTTPDVNVDTNIGAALPAPAIAPQRSSLLPYLIAGLAALAVVIALIWWVGQDDEQLGGTGTLSENSYATFEVELEQGQAVRFRANPTDPGLDLVIGIGVAEADAIEGTLEFAQKTEGSEIFSELFTTVPDNAATLPSYITEALYLNYSIGEDLPFGDISAYTDNAEIDMGEADWTIVPADGTYYFYVLDHDGQEGGYDVAIEKGPTFDVSSDDLLNDLQSEKWLFDSFFDPFEYVEK